MNATHEDVIQTLKFIPHDITITISGRGGEIVMGEIDPEAYAFWTNTDIELGELAGDWDNELDIPDNARFINSGCWHDVDDIAHHSGASMSESATIAIVNSETNEMLFESTTEPSILEDAGVQIEDAESIEIDDQPAGACVFVGCSYEKGVFFEGTIRLTAPFNPSKLKVNYCTFDDWSLVTSIEYNDEEVDGQDAYDTSGKGSNFFVAKA